MPTEDMSKDRYVVPGLRRGLMILRLFSKTRRVITIPQIVRELGISRATAFRLTYTLETDGYLRRVPHSNAFQLGLNVLSLGFEYLGSLELVEVARLVLEDLRDQLDASTHMGVLDGTEVVYILKAPSQHRLRSNVTIGGRMPAHATSIGRALLFDTPLEQLRVLYRGVKLEVFSGQTPRTVAELHEMLEEERQKGYVSYRSAYVAGIASVAAPVRDASGQIVAAINVSDYESLPSMQDEKHLADAVCHAAMTISRGLGYRPDSVSGGRLLKRR